MSDEQHPYEFADLTREQMDQFIAACIAQASDPRKVVGDLIRDYAQLHNPKVYDGLRRLR